MYADDTQVECKLTAKTSCELQLAMDACMKNVHKLMNINKLDRELNDQGVANIVEL